MRSIKTYLSEISLETLALALVFGGTACRTLGQVAPAKLPTETLEIVASWRLQSPVGRFDASGIERSPEGELLVVRDAELAVYAVRFGDDDSEATLVKHGRYSVPKADLNVGPTRFDVEGLAFDDDGVLYACDEYARRVLRFTARGLIDSLPINLDSVASYFSETNVNASFEGIAIGGGKLYLANERSKGRLIELDLATGQTLGSFECRTGTSIWPDPHYSGLDWHNGRLYALMREEQSILEINPSDRSVTRVLRYHDIEFAKDHRYRTLVPLSGVMEGVLIEGETIWLLTDNNGQGRYADQADRRPSLFKCRIADRP